jgi:hypothetical protein
MSIQRLGTMVLLGSAWLVGCSKEEGRPAGPPKPPPAEPSIFGEWTTSTAPELVNSKTTLTYRATGEFRATGPLRLLGKTITIKGDDGKERIAPFIGSGTWTREGDRITTLVSVTNLQDWKGEPTTSRIVKLTEEQLVLDHDGEVTTYFRSKPTEAPPGAAKSP